MYRKWTIQIGAAAALALLGGVCFGQTGGRPTLVQEQDLVATSPIDEALIHPPVPIPVQAMDRPAGLWALPVFLVPKGLETLFPALGAPTLNLARTPFVEPFASQCALGRNNLSVHLQIARRKYLGLLRNPLSGKDRGTFRVASWDHATGKARQVPGYRTQLEPLIVRTPNFTPAQISAGQSAGDWRFLAPIFDAAGCMQSNCPFVFVVAIAGDPLNPEGGAKFNQGFANGGGVIMFNYSSVWQRSWNSASDAHNFQSTLIHELGHAFGAPHSDGYCPLIGPARTCPDYYQLSTSPSIMGYAEANWVLGCPLQSRGSQMCVFPDDPKVIDSYPGVLIPEDLRIMAANDLAFPDLEFERAVDAPLAVVLMRNAVGSVRADEDANHIRLVGPSVGYPPDVLIGGYSQRFRELWEAGESGEFSWLSTDDMEGTWANIQLHFPQTVTLERVRFYTGATGTAGQLINRPSRVRIIAAGQTVEKAAGATNVVDLLMNISTANLTLGVRRGASGQVSLRGLRFFGRRSGGPLEECYPPAEPVASTGFSSILATGPELVVGSDQVVRAYGESFDPTSMWHSSKQPAGSWVSVDVTFPDTVVLGHVLVHSGHSGTHHFAREIQVERRCICRDPGVGLGVCRLGSSTCQGATSGDARFDFIRRVSGAPNVKVDAGSASGRVWRISFRTALGSEAADPGWMTIRGLRFFDPKGREIFRPALIHH